MTLGLCLIIKDETTELHTLFSSAGLDVFDEIVVAWNGSNPETKEILESYGCKVTAYEWQDNFAHARNFSFGLSSCDYLMWLDADDTLVGSENLREVLADATLNSSVYSVFMPYHYDHDKDGNVAMLLWRERIVKRASHEWVGAIHESLLPTIDGTNYRTEKVYVKHNVDNERVARSGVRNLRISEAEYKKERLPNASCDPRTTLYYAKALHAMGRFAESIPVFEEYLETSEWDDERYQVYLILATLYINSKQYSKALECGRQSITLRPLYGQAYYMLAQVYFHLEKYEEVVHFCEIGAKSLMPSEIIPTDPTEYTVKPLIIYEYAMFQMGQAQKSLAAIDMGLKQFPSNEHLQSRKKSVMAYLSRMEMEDAAHKLCHWLETYEKTDIEKMQAFLYSLPLPVQDHPKYQRMINEYKVNDSTIDGGNRIAIYCGPTFETWGPEDVKSKGLGGSEEAVVYLSKELVKLGWCVDVYSNCSEPGQYDGVNYFNFWTFSKDIPYDIFVGWRNSEYIELANENSKKFLWLHDVQKAEYYTPERIAKIYKIICLSKWHRDNLPEIPDEKFFLSRNGIVQSDFSMAGRLPRDPLKCIYASSPDRGLDILLEIWPKIKARTKDATLHIFYGFTHTYDKLHANRVKMIAYKEHILSEVKKLDGVIYHGKVGHAELHEHFMSAGLWLYPTHFTEISCITAMKAQAAGMIPVTMTIAALDETVQHGYKISFPIEDTRSRKAFENITVDLLNNIEKQEKLRSPMMKWAKDYYSWTNVAKQWDELFKEVSIQCK